ncbi:uncharacterized protein LOC112559729 isoform X2 [Pomacea canaliculata]|uniref:uncharacterized protein LOC112559729 isoform X2 n=1 Tax=Pomacea canaliculata TaxID=400727 RepID=UPI000D728DC0|nr:uncharacterized protein LOC112559729 isoform X2 [Pomacea canaliculata]
MPNSCFVLTGLLLFFVQPVLGKNCTNILSSCQTILRLSPEFAVTDAQSCQTIEDHDKECNSYQNFWACVKSNMSSCGMDSQTVNKINHFREKYNSRCYPEMICYLKVWKCHCLHPVTYTSQSTDNRCKHLDLYQDCISKITNCDHSTHMHNATTTINTKQAVCNTECPDSLPCWTNFTQRIASSSGGFNFSIDNKRACRIFKALFKCLAKRCSPTLSDKWRRVGKSYGAACSVYIEMTSSESCSSFLNCQQTFEVMSGITIQETSADETISLANAEKAPLPLPIQAGGVNY